MPDSNDQAKRTSPVQHLDLCVEDPAPLRRPGNFNYNQESSKDPHEWANMAKFDTWRRAKELTYSIKLIAATVAHEKTLWKQQHHYICSCEPSGGSTQKERPEQCTHFQSKKAGCDCKIVIKSYPHMPTILGRYEEEHDHDVGLANLAYTRLSNAVRIQIRNMLERKIDPKEIVCK